VPTWAESAAAELAQIPGQLSFCDDAEAWANATSPFLAWLERQRREAA
jgi:hypothetical protein